MTKRKKKHQVGSVKPHIFGLCLPQGLYSDKLQLDKVYIRAKTLVLAKRVANTYIKLYTLYISRLDQHKYCLCSLVALAYLE